MTPSESSRSAKTAPEVPQSEESSSALDDPRVARALDAYLTALEEGKKVDREELLRRYPEIADELARCLDALEFVSRAAPELDEQASSRGQTPLAGDLHWRQPIGDFHIIRELGRGGMGVVYEAEQLSLGRPVALKVLPFAAMLDQRQLQRFQNEARAAASLKHPNIVGIHSVGCERGVHYYAMEYVEGQTLAQVIAELRQRSVPVFEDEKDDPDDRVAEAKRSGAPESETQREPQAGVLTEGSTRSPECFRSVANLGIQAAEALEHAHQVGVVHRDIKPSNLMVDAEGHLWITDFGLAQVESNPDLTMTGDFLGTLRYMSPEQATGKRRVLDHHTDIYSLGVTLYELFTLQPAFAGDNRQELSRQITDEDPPPPRQINKAVPKDLETIVLKAMAKEPEARYASARELADDLARFLGDKPIQAKRPGFVERVTKWTHRHSGLVASGIILLLIASLGLAGSTILILGEQKNTANALEQAEANYQEAEKQRQRAEANFQKALDAVDQMLTRVADEQLAHVPQMEPVRQALLEDALSFYQDFLQESSSDPTVRLETGEAWRRVGSIQDLLGQYEQAEKACREAITLLQRLVADVPSEPSYTAALAWSYHQLGNTLWQVGRNEEAEVACRQAIHSWEKLTLQDTGMYLQALVASQQLLGRVLRPMGRYEEAEQVLRRTLRLQENLAADSPGGRYRLAVNHHMLGNVLVGMARDREAEEAYRQALAIERQLLDESPGDPAHGHFVALLDTALGDLLRRNEQLEEAEKLYREGVAVSTTLARDFPYMPRNWGALISNYSQLGDLLSGTNRPEEAERVYSQVMEADLHDAQAYVWRAQAWELRKKFEQALADYEKAVELEPNNAAWHDRLAFFFSSCGAVHLRDYHLAVEHAKKAVELAAENPNYWITLGMAYVWLGDYQQALVHYEKALELDPSFAAAYEQSCMACYHLRDYDRALTYAEESIKAAPSSGHGYWHRANVYCKLKQYDKALADYSEAIERNPDSHLCWRDRGWTRYHLNDYEKSLADVSKAIQLNPYDPIVGSYRARILADCPDQAFRDGIVKLATKAIATIPDYPLAYSARGSIYAGLNEYDKALVDYMKAIELLGQETPTSRRETGRLYLEVAMIHGKRGQEDQAREAYRKAIGLFEALTDDFPDYFRYRHDLGVAQYRAGNWDAAIEALDKSLELQGDNSHDYLFLAMAHWQLGQPGATGQGTGDRDQDLTAEQRAQHKDEAGKQYQEAVEWMEKNKPDDEELRRFRAEAEELIGPSEDHHGDTEATEKE